MKFRLIVTGGKISKSQQNSFCTKFAHNVTFPRALGKCPKILLSSDCGGAWCEDSWNGTEIWIDCHIVRVRLQIPSKSILVPICPQCKSFW